MRQHKGWFGVDFDGTLAFSPGEKWGNGEFLGEPVPAMLEQVKALIAEGEDVRIFTARVAVTDAVNDQGQAADEKFGARQRELVEAWCEKHLGRKLPVTATKDFQMVALFDDRAVQIVKDQGVPIVDEAFQLLAAAEELYLALGGCTLTPKAKAAAEALRLALGLPDAVKLTNVEERRILTR